MIVRNTVAINADGLVNKEFIDRVTHTPPITSLDQRTKTSAQPELDLTEDRAPSEVRGNHANNEKYVIDRILRHIGKGVDFHYDVQRFSYGHKDNTVESARHVIQYFITDYWKYITEKDK